MVRIENLQKKYGVFSVLKGLNMTINKGDVYGFLGKNGCGKTTTMNIICNIIPKDGGKIILGDGNPVKIGYLPETPALFNYMTGYEYLEYIAACADYKANRRIRTEDVLDIVGMREGGKRRIKGYSRGMVQRLGIAATIYDKPDLLILDEPTSALDPQGRAEVIEIINRLKNDGTTILLCTHILSDVERVANRVGIMHNGVLEEEGTLEELCEKQELQKISLSFFKTNQKIIDLINDIKFADKITYNDQNSEFSVYTKDAADTSKQLIQFFAVSDLVPQKFQVEKRSLENVYIDVVNKGGEKNGY